MTHDAEILRLFPLGLVLFPGLPLPLHIFEDRYKQMIGECIDTGEPFGLIYIDGTQMRTIGCTAKVEDIIKQYDDGKLDLIARGDRRFRLLGIEEDTPYHVGRVQYLDETPEPGTPQLDRIVAQTLSQLKRLAQITGSEIDFETLREMDPMRISYLVAGLDAFSPDEKQFFLEISSTSQRLLACVQSLANVVQTYDIGREARELLPEGRLLHRLN